MKVQTSTIKDRIFVENKVEEALALADKCSLGTVADAIEQYTLKHGVHPHEDGLVIIQIGKFHHMMCRKDVLRTDVSMSGSWSGPVRSAMVSTVMDRVRYVSCVPAVEHI